MLRRLGNIILRIVCPVVLYCSWALCWNGIFGHSLGPWIFELNRHYPQAGNRFSALNLDDCKQAGAAFELCYRGKKGDKRGW
jgi:hypothetical protein